MGVCVWVWAVRKCSMGKKKKKGSKMVNVLNGPNPIYYPLSDDLFKQLAHYRFWPSAEISVWVGIRRVGKNNEYVVEVTT